MGIENLGVIIFNNQQIETIQLPVEPVEGETSFDGRRIQIVAPQDLALPTRITLTGFFAEDLVTAGIDYIINDDSFEKAAFYPRKGPFVINFRFHAGQQSKMVYLTGTNQNEVQNPVQL